MSWWLGFLKEPAGTLNNGKLFLQTAVFLWFFFSFINKNVLNERLFGECSPSDFTVVLAYFLLCLDPCDENGVAALNFFFLTQCFHILISTLKESLHLG